MKTTVFIILLMSIAVSIQAEVIGLDVDYEHDGVKLKGYLAYDVADNSIRPGVLVVHEWWGLNDYAKQRARDLAELGFMAFACDMYGAEIVTESWEEAPKLAGPFYDDRELMRTRAAEGLKMLKNHTLCDKNRVAAVGYCFGGTCALELARSGADLRGVVSFHGGLNTPDPEDTKNIKAKILVCHGGDDSFVNDAEVVAFEKEMRDGGVNWQLNSYGGAVHSFTNPKSGDDPSKGVAYHAQAATRSWEAMRDFFREIFAK
jgi:dienelactone hydrolase